MLNTNIIVPRSNADMRKLIISDTLTLFSKNRLFQKGHVCPIEIGVFGNAEYEYNSSVLECRHAKIDNLGYPNIILKNRLFQKGHVCPIEIGVFGDAEYK